MMASPLPLPQLGELSDSHLCGLAVLCRYLTSINSWAELTLVQRGRGGWWMDQTHPFGNSEVVLKVKAHCVMSVHSMYNLLKMFVCVCVNPSSVWGGVCCVPHQRAVIQNMGRDCAQFAVSLRRCSTTHLLSWEPTLVGCLVTPSLPSLPSLPSPPSPPLILVSPPLSRFLHVFLHHSLSADSPADSPTGPPLAAALQWFTCLKRRVAQLEGHSTVYWDDGGPTRKRLMTEGCLSLPPFLSLSLCVCACPCVSWLLCTVQERHRCERCVFLPSTAAQLLSDCDKLEAVEPLHSAFQAACLVGSRGARSCSYTAYQSLLPLPHKSLMHLTCVFP